ncbi:MAG TPA: hypothetical protein VFW51_06290 [Actinomycetota bacterium]|nr:hypothetical protein [Actinomycetota bacterium]
MAWLLATLVVLGLGFLGFLFGATSAEGGMEDHWRRGLWGAVIGAGLDLAIVIKLKQDQRRGR